MEPIELTQKVERRDSSIAAIALTLTCSLLGNDPPLWSLREKFWSESASKCLTVTQFESSPLCLLQRTVLLLRTAMQTYGQLCWTSSSIQQTPWSFNTGSFADASEHRKQVDHALREELLPTLRIDIPNFIPAVFGHIPQLDELADTVFDRCQEEDTRLYIKGSGRTEWPPSAKEDLVLEWLQDLMKHFVAWTNGVHHAASRQIYKGPSTYLDGSPIKRKMDVGVMACHGQSKTDHGMTYKPKCNWAQMLVIGELKSNPIEDIIE